MIEQLHIHQKVEKDIEQMKVLDNAPAVASGRARAIIDALLEGKSIAQAGLLSRSKDARVKNLFKYNLGKGYRLMTIKDKNRMFILFIGDHDQCDRWLDANSKKNPQHRPLPVNVYPVCRCNSKNKRQHRQQDDSVLWQEEEDPEIFSSITQKDLRRVFSGLTG